MVQGIIGPDQFEDFGTGSRRTRDNRDGFKSDRSRPLDQWSGAVSELNNVRFRSFLLSINFKHIFMAHLTDLLRLCRKFCT